MTMTQPTLPPASVFERDVLIRFSHCDPAGIVFFPQYLVMFNNPVEDWITDGLGISYANLLGPRRVGLPTVNLQCDFKASSRMGDMVTYGVSVQRLGNRSLELALYCRCGDELRVQVRQTMVCTSLDTHRAIVLPDDLRAAMEKFQQNPKEISS